MRRPTDPQNLHSVEGIAIAKRATQHDQPERRRRCTKLKRQKVLDVRKYAFALLDRTENRAEVIVGQNHIRGFLRNIRSEFAHGNADVGFLECGRVVDTLMECEHCFS